METAKQHSSEHALSTRATKRAKAAALGVDDDFVSQMVERFYASVRSDELLAPIFEARVAEWPQHLDQMKRFWRSVLFSSGEFNGNPQLKHMVIPKLGEAHFVRWLELFYAVLRELEHDPGGTQLVASKARSIADSLLTGISIRRAGISGARTGKELPHA